MIALSGRYEQILNYVVSVDFISIGLTGAALFVYRRPRRARRASARPATRGRRVFFVLSCWLVVAATVYRYPRDSATGLAILALGLPVSFLWRGAAAARRARGRALQETA